MDFNFEYNIETIFCIIVGIILYIILYLGFFRYFYINNELLLPPIELFTHPGQPDRYYYYKLEKKDKREKEDE
jgi:hypothetical protein